MQALNRNHVVRLIYVSSPLKTSWAKSQKLYLRMYIQTLHKTISTYIVCSLQFLSAFQLVVFSEQYYYQHTALETLLQ